MDERRSRKNKPTMEFEISFFEAILRDKPDFIEALAALGDLYTKNGQYKKGLDVDLKLSQLRENDPGILYNLACSYSLLNDVSRALATLEQAIQCGYSDFAYIEYDNDLMNLRKDSRFQELFSTIKKKNPYFHKPQPSKG